VNYSELLLILTESLKIEDVEEISRSLYSLGSLLTGDDVNIDKIASDITESYEEQQEEDILLHLNKESLEERIRFILLNSNSIKLSFQAFDLIYTSNNLVRSTDITTDVRVFFEEDLKTRHGVYMHKLKITFDHEDDYNQTIKLSLDKDDLKKLRAQIDVSLLAEENIRMNNQGVINFIDFAE
jgi:hypothetical protein